MLPQPPDNLPDKPAWLQETSNASYHAAKWAVSNSMLSTFIDSPRDYHDQYIFGNTRESSEAMGLGTALHASLLDDDDGFTAQVALIPEELLPRSTTKYKAWAATNTAENPARVLLMPSQWEKVQAMRDAIISHPLASYLIGLPGWSEQAVFWRDKDTGLLRRAKADAIKQMPKTLPEMFIACLKDYRGSQVLIDLKTSRSTKPWELAYSFFDYGYHRQCVFYGDGFMALDGRFRPTIYVTVQNEPPWTVWVCDLSGDQWLDLALDEVQDALARLKACYDTGDWRDSAWETCRSKRVVDTELYRLAMPRKVRERYDRSTLHSFRQLLQS